MDLPLARLERGCKGYADTVEAGADERFLFYLDTSSAPGGGSVFKEQG